MWIYINNLDQVIWLAENWKWVWHLKYSAWQGLMLLTLAALHCRAFHNHPFIVWYELNTLVIIIIISWLLINMQLQDNIHINGPPLGNWLAACMADLTPDLQVCIIRVDSRVFPLSAIPLCQLLFIPWRGIMIPRHSIVAGYYGFTLDVLVSVHVSVHQSYVRPSVHLYFISGW